MLDIALLRKDTQAVAARLKDRGYTLDLDGFNSLESRRKSVQTETETLQARRNALAKQIGMLKAKGEDASAVLAESQMNEDDPNEIDQSLNLYNPEIKPPYSADFLARFRTAQIARIRRRTAWVKQVLEDLKKKGGKEMERGFITHRTMAEPRFLDGTIDPNDRKVGWCWLGDPETVNNGPISLARFSTLRSWLSQWSIDDTNIDAERDVQSVTVPLLAVENSADDSVPQPHTKRVFDRAASKDKRMIVVQGANHYYVGQPEKLKEACDVTINWLRERSFIE